MPRKYTKTLRSANALALGGLGYLAGKRSRNATVTKKKKAVARKPPSKRKVKVHQNVMPSAAGGTFSKFFFGSRLIPRKYRGVVKSIAKNYQAYNNAGRLSSTSPGIQSAVIINTIYGYTDLNNINGHLNSGAATNKILHMVCSSEAMLTNQDQGNVRIAIYDIIARRDYNGSGSAKDPFTAWSNSYNDQGGNATDWHYVGATPFSSDLFVQFFKVCKITHVILSPGQSHNHRISFQANKEVDNEVINYETASLKGFTLFQMLVAHGEPYNDATTKTQVTTGNVNIDYVCRRQYKWTYVQDYGNNWYVTNSLPTAFTVAESIIDPESGAINAAASNA